jgi:methionine-rich copper-binding protein CopC
LLLPALIVAVSTESARGHASYDRSVPGDGEIVAESPARVDVYFTQEIRRTSELPTLIVVNQSGNQVQTQTVLNDADRTHMYAELAPALPDGRYTVIWHTFSDDDGEEAQGAFHFYVGSGPEDGTATPAPTAAETPAASPTLDPSPTGSPSGTPVPTASPATTVTPSPLSTLEPDDDDGGDGPSEGAVAGIAVGSMLGGVVVGGGLTWFAMRRRS